MWLLMRSTEKFNFFLQYVKHYNFCPVTKYLKWIDFFCVTNVFTLYLYCVIIEQTRSISLLLGCGYYHHFRCVRGYNKKENIKKVLNPPLLVIFWFSSWKYLRHRQCSLIESKQFWGQRPPFTFIQYWPEYLLCIILCFWCKKLALKNPPKVSILIEKRNSTQEIT